MTGMSNTEKEKEKMKRTISNPMMLLAMGTAIAMTACSSYEGMEDGNGTAGNMVRLTFTAQQEQGDGTRTAIDADDSKRINWQEGDRISVLAGQTNGKFTLASGAGTTKATFTGTTEEAQTYTALYPYQATASLSNGILTATLPAVQTATAGTFDPDAALMMAVADGKDFRFRNCVSYIKVTTDEAAQSITFASLDGRSVAGTVAIDYNNGEPVATVSYGGSLSATLQPRQGETTIAAGTYYIAVMPQAMELGFKLAYVDADGVTHNRVYTGTKFNAKRNKVSDMGTLNATNTYTNRQIVYYADSKIDGFSRNAVADVSGTRIHLNDPGTEMTHEFKDGIGVLTFKKDVSSLTYLFYDHAANITKVILPEALTSISNFCFYESQIEELYIPQSVTNISNAIDVMPKLRKVVLPANEAIMHEDIISSCNALQAIYGPYTNQEHNTIVKDNVLIYVALGNLTSFVVPTGITRIGGYALDGENLENITIPESVEEIGTAVFSGTAKLTSITLPSSLRTIGDLAFKDSGITTITIPKSVQSLGRTCFGLTRKLETVVFEEGTQITAIPDYAFMSSNAQFDIPASVTSIGSYAFCNYNRYRTTKADIVIPDNVETIGGYAYYNAANIESITLGAKVRKVDGYAFGGIWAEGQNNGKEDIPVDQQTNLKYIYSKNTTPPTLDEGALMYTKMDDFVAIYVPAASVEAYKAADVWRNYADKIKAME